MFRVNDIIMYGTNGICEIVEITEKDFMGTKKEYYVLKPMGNKTSTFFAPVNSPKTEEKMRRILSKEEIYQLIHSISQEEPNWIQSDNERKDTYRRIILSGNHEELINMIRALCLHKKQREAEGRHLYLSDERFLKEAERMLYDEFQYVLNINREDLLPFIFQKIEQS